MINFRRKFEEIEELELLLCSSYDTRHSVSQISTKSINGRTPDPVVNAFYRLEYLSEKLEAAREDWLNDAEEIEAWLVECVPDVEVQAIIRFHFILGYNWKETNLRIHGYYSYHHSRNKYERYVEKNHLFETEPV